MYKTLKCTNDLLEFTLLTRTIKVIVKTSHVVIKSHSFIIY